MARQARKPPQISQHREEVHPRRRQKLTEQGKTVIVATHDRSIVKEADIRIELIDGRIISTGNYVAPTQSLTMMRKKKGKKK